jgi:hypothetical protein
MKVLQMIIGQTTISGPSGVFREFSYFSWFTPIAPMWEAKPADNDEDYCGFMFK